MSVYDLTLAITSDLVVFPGDPSFESQKVMDVDNADPFTLCHFGLGNHAGTHIDFPAHVIPGGSSSDAYPLDYLTAPGRIIEIPDNGSVTSKHVENAGIERDEIVFFKTSNTRRHLHQRSIYTEDFAAITPEASQKLADKEVRIVGIDYLSVDAIDDEALSSHNTLLSHNILIVENLNLTEVPNEQCQISIAPLKVSGSDGLPVRVAAFC